VSPARIFFVFLFAFVMTFIFVPRYFLSVDYRNQTPPFLCGVIHRHVIHIDIINREANQTLSSG